MPERYDQIAAVQRDVREVYVGGFVGQLVSGVVWLVAATVATFVSLGAGAAALWIGGSLIFPLTTLCLRLSGRPSSLPSGHPMVGLATQVAFTVPAGLLLAIALGQHRAAWFFPASMVVVGAHYLPFVFLYGQRLFAVLATVLVCGGVVIALGATGAPDTTGGWFTGAVLVVFAFVLRESASRRRDPAAPQDPPVQDVGPMSPGEVVRERRRTGPCPGP